MDLLKISLFWVWQNSTVPRDHDISISDGEITNIDYAANDLLDCLDDVISPAQAGISDQGDFQKAMDIVMEGINWPIF